MSHKKIYFNKLDSLRVFAFLLVFWQHSFDKFMLKVPSSIFEKLINRIIFTGGFGVHIFFVLSGFLITYLLLLENEKNKKINIIYFYIRRVLRIWPLYYIIVIVGALILPFLFNNFAFDGVLWMHLVFLNNFNVVSSPVGITWSVAIEEQFYLIWPIIFFLFKIHLRGVSFFLLLCSLIYSISSTSFINQYYHTFSNIQYLMSGCFFAQLYFSNNRVLNKIINSKYLSVNKLIGLLFIIFILSSFGKTMSIISNIVLLFSIGLFIVFLTKKSNSDLTKTSKIGKYTYGLYLYHPFVILGAKSCFDKLDLNYLDNNFIYLALVFFSLFFSYIISKMSYELVEKKILKYKINFNPKL